MAHLPTEVIEMYLSRDDKRTYEWSGDYDSGSPKWVQIVGRPGWGVALQQPLDCQYAKRWSCVTCGDRGTCPYTVGEDRGGGSGVGRGWRQMGDICATCAARLVGDVAALPDSALTQLTMEVA